MGAKGLGKGLDALIPQKGDDKKGERVLSVEIDKIRPSRWQPRVEFGKEKLEELTASIREKGVVQPVLVRRAGEGFELIAGERRLKAARDAGLKELPAIVRDVEDVDVLEISLIENVQREDLNPIDEAHAYEKLIKEFDFTQERIAKTIGKNRTTVANTIRLLSLPKKIQDFLSKGLLSMGHGRAILGLNTGEEQKKVSEKIIKMGLSVREVENYISKRLKGLKKKTITPRKDAELMDIEERLQRKFGTRVRISQRKKGGKIEIEYYSHDDLDRLLRLLG